MIERHADKVEVKPKKKKPKKIPRLDISLCVSCGTCIEKCRKNAMSMVHDKPYFYHTWEK
jgi:formate hydrogenlyase subunit 6/NADH:ubiquinone oxidoreductase subunit I